MRKMWEFFKYFILVFLGAGIGTVLMCILSASKDADRMIEEMNKVTENKESEEQ
ncbi:DUF3789 domain-containing protein [Thomasclavelia ramosa]|uniref:DUF3789 domain-containing protein n=2 Tax=Bacillota TaxID=1239 RepID=UPI001F18A000|nr:DUF3789 domain-containing protein [Thomasclavelia ramosa]MCR1958252.1 DUF3789 domain-containing protein [Thomasclavelia ramosa]